MAGKILAEAARLSARIKERGAHCETDLITSRRECDIGTGLDTFAALNATRKKVLFALRSRWSEKFGVALRDVTNTLDGNEGGC